MSYADAGITIEREGARLWITLPLGSPAKAGVKRAGAHWHPESKRWWIGAVKSDTVTAALDKALNRAVAAYRRQADLAATVTRRTREDILADAVTLYVPRTDRPTQDLIRAVGGWFEDGHWMVHRDDEEQVEASLNRPRRTRSDMTMCPHCYTELTVARWERSGCCFYGPGGVLGYDADGKPRYEWSDR